MAPLDWESSTLTTRPLLMTDCTSERSKKFSGTFSSVVFQHKTACKMQKQLSGGVILNRCPEKICKIHRKTPVPQCLESGVRSFEEHFFHGTTLGNSLRRCTAK